MTTMTLDEQIDFFDESLRKLKAKYDLFFNGAIKIPPNEDRRRLDAILHEMSRITIRDNSRRFRFNTLLSRYNQYRELWGRQMREREEGPMDFRRRAAAFRIDPATASAARNGVTSDAADSYVRVSPGTNGEAYRKIFQQIVEAQQKLGKPQQWSLEQVAAMVQNQASSLRTRFGVKVIAFRVETVDGKVKLKARPEQDYI